MSPKLSTLLASAALVLALPAAAQETTYKFAHFLPATHPLWVDGGQVFTDAVTEATGGNIKWEVFPAGQLGKDNLAVVTSGLADISIIATSYAPEKFPVSSVSELPGLYASACEGTGRFWHLAKEGGPIDVAEYDPLGIRVLYVLTLPPYTLMTTRKAVGTKAELEGLKIRANGPAMDKTIRALGAVPVRVPSSEMYDASSRGTIDGAVYPYGGVTPYKLEEVLHYGTQGAMLGSGSILIAMSQKGWDSLSDDMKTAFDAAAAKAQRNLCEAQDRQEAMFRDEIVARAGFTVVELSQEERDLWQTALSSVAEDWAKEMDAQGKNGSALLDAYRAADPAF